MFLLSIESIWTTLCFVLQAGLLIPNFSAIELLHISHSTTLPCRCHLKNSSTMPTLFPYLPTPILQTIFKWCCGHGPVHLPLQDSDPRQVLGIVSPTWANIIHSTAFLWDNILFTKPPNNTSHRPYPLLDDFHDCTIYSGQNPLNITFDMVCGGWDLSIVSSVIIPHMHRIKTLNCPIYGDNDIARFLKIGEGRFNVLESMEICFINTWETPCSSFPLEECLQFTALRTVPHLRKAVFRLVNDLNPIDLLLPWRQLTTLDLGTTAMLPEILVKILHSAMALEDGFFYVQFTRPIHPQLALSRRRITMRPLRKLRLRLLYPSEDTRLFSILRFPSLQKLWIEMYDEFQDWNISLYMKMLKASTQSLRQLSLSDFSPEEPGMAVQGIIESDAVRRRHRPTTYQTLERFFEVIANVETLYLPLGVNIHACTVEKMASCALLPHLRSLELGTVNGRHILSMVRRRHMYVLDASWKPSTSTLRPTSLESVTMFIPRHGCSGGDDDKAALVQDAQALEAAFGITCCVQSTQMLPLPMRQPRLLELAQQFDSFVEPSRI